MKKSILKQQQKNAIKSRTACGSVLWYVSYNYWVFRSITVKGKE